MKTKEEMMEYFAAQREYDRLNPSPKVKDMTNPPKFAEIVDIVKVYTVDFLKENPEGTLEEFANYVREYAELEEFTDEDMFAARVITDTGEDI